MLELGDHDLIALRERSADGFGDQAKAVGGATGEDDLFPARGADEPLDGVAGQLVELGRLFAQGMDRAVNVRVTPLVILAHRLDHGPPPLARGTPGGVNAPPAVADPLRGPDGPAA